jgi:hypothetical protein
MGVSGRPIRASAFSTDSETPLCSDQPNENSPANTKAENGATKISDSSGESFSVSA